MSARSFRSASASVTRRSSVSFSAAETPFALAQRALRQHLRGRLRAGAEHAGDLAALVAHRRIRKREPGLLVVALAVHDERKILAIGGLTGHRRVDQRADVRPDLRPDVVEPLPERARVLRAEDLGVRVVVEKAEVLAPRDEHREPRLQQQADDGSQRRGHDSGGPSGEADQSCERMSAPTAPPPARKSRGWITREL